jgi:hypothetical protein
MIFWACTSQKPEKTSGTGDIIKLGKKESLSKVALILDQSKELKIYDLTLGAETSKSHFYKIYIYREKNSQSRLFYESTCIYDKYSYNWINDTTLNIKVFSNSRDCFASFNYKIENEGFSFGFDTVSPTESVQTIGVFNQE